MMTAGSETEATGSGRRLVERLSGAPRLADPVEARSRLADLASGADDGAAELRTLLDRHEALEALLSGLADHSPFLWRLASSDVPRLVALLEAEPEVRSAALINRVHDLWRPPTTEPQLMRGLRKAKQEMALLAALADIGGAWGVDRVTETLSDFADACVAASLRWLLSEAAGAGRFNPPDPQDPAAESGVVVLALGKHGARELNYSSDIDIVVFFDPETAPLAAHVEATPFFVRMVKGVVKLLQERTPDGYVFRTDLRLRPDPASTPSAIPLPSAYAYYESVGQNWERAALIKARPVAGDLPIGERFLQELTPFIWRKYFDFAAVADIHAMKRQIHAVRGHDVIAVAGHNIKLGRGGIREVEFFVQTQQLVFGGRRPQLRGRRTLEMLSALRADGWISETAERELTDAYRFLRTVEHRLQMQADEQTQQLPHEEDKLARFAKFCGYASTTAFSKALTAQALKVEGHYAKLFEEGGELTAGDGNLVFTGVTDDPETLETLRRMGFSDPAVAAETVRGWHFGRRQAVTSPRAREVLTELTPPLLAAFGATADPDGALANLDRALARMPAAVELFSILKNHRSILSMFADLLGSAPRLAEMVAQKPHLLDAVIDPALNRPYSTVEDLVVRLTGAVGAPDLLEDFLDRIREAGQHEMFLVGSRAISEAVPLSRIGVAYALLAEALIQVALAEVERRFRADHGLVPGGRLAVVAMGRLGSAEMTATSDLDLVVLYDFDEDAAESDGPRPLNAVVYYTRLTQRLISALTAPTRRGVLYAIDMRLRPSGNKGPAATQYKGFLAYQQEEAEVWEQLALTRARPVAGDPLFMEEVAGAIHAILTAERDADHVRREAAAMRRLIAQEKGEEDAWDLKLARGGLLDIEFIAQTLVLSEGRAHPSLVKPSTADILQAAQEHGLLAAEDGEHLREAFATMRDLLHWQRLTVAGAFDPRTAANGLKRRMAAIVGLPDFKVLERDLVEKQAQVRAIFTKLLG